VGDVEPSLSASKSSQGYLGVDLRDISDEQMAALKLKETRGAEIVNVDHDGPACKSGMRMHDVILQMNGTVIDGEEQLRRMLRETPPGRTVSFVISRDGQQITISAQMANREQVEREAWEQHYKVPEPAQTHDFGSTPHAGSGFFSGNGPSGVVTTGAKGGHRDILGTTMILSSSFTGAKLEVMGPQLAEFFGAQGSAGLLVRSVDANSPAWDAGMRAGDVVVKVNSIPVVTGNDWSKTVHENRGKAVPVVVLREKREKTLMLTPDGKKRSSVEPGMGIEEFFGGGAQAEETRATLAELQPMFDAITNEARQQVEALRSSPEMAQMIARLEAFAANPEFDRQMEMARRQVAAAAEAARQKLLSSPEVRQRMN
jgi:membrane-associated protease RseP (regulator of RpoE activity)